LLRAGGVTLGLLNAETKRKPAANLVASVRNSMLSMPPTFMTSPSVSICAQGRQIRFNRIVGTNEIIRLCAVAIDRRWFVLQSSQGEVWWLQ
jgi:hypothetical protein